MTTTSNLPMLHTTTEVIQWYINTPDRSHSAKQKCLLNSVSLLQHAADTWIKNAVMHADVDFINTITPLLRSRAYATVLHDDAFSDLLRVYPLFNTVDAFYHPHDTTELAKSVITKVLSFGLHGTLLQVFGKYDTFVKDVESWVVNFVKITNAHVADADDVKLFVLNTLVTVWTRVFDNTVDLSFTTPMDKQFYHSNNTTYDNFVKIKTMVFDLLYWGVGSQWDQQMQQLRPVLEQIALLEQHTVFKITNATVDTQNMFRKGAQDKIKKTVDEILKLLSDNAIAVVLPPPNKRKRSTLKEKGDPVVPVIAATEPFPSTEPVSETIVATEPFPPLPVEPKTKNTLTSTSIMADKLRKKGYTVK